MYDRDRESLRRLQGTGNPYWKNYIFWQHDPAPEVEAIDEVDTPVGMPVDLGEVVPVEIQTENLDVSPVVDSRAEESTFHYVEPVERPWTV